MRKESRQSKRTRQLGSIERDILERLTLGDLLYGFLLSARSTGRMQKRTHEHAMIRYRRKLAIQRLAKLDYVRTHDKKISLTSAGEHALGIAVNKNLKLLKSRTWDHKWRIAAFDIPETQAPLRRTVRAVLKRAGFVKLQQSIWVFPHECETIVQLIKHESGLTNHILYGVLDRIENESRLKKLFQLL